MSYKDFPKSVRLNKVIFDITKFVCALLAGLVIEIFLVVLCLDIRIATLIAAYISYKINDGFYYSYIRTLNDNTRICYCKKLDVFIRYDEYEDDVSPSGHCHRHRYSGPGGDLPAGNPPLPLQPGKKGL